MRDKTEKMKLSEHGVIREEALLAYLNNELTVDDKRELEKLLKEDPFAQEALEGLQQSNKTRASAVVLSINQKVKERSGLREGKVVKLHWTTYAWAAAVFGLLIGVGFLMVTFMGKPDGQLAMNKEAKEQVVMEEKPATPNLVPADAPVIDSASAALSEQPVATGFVAPLNPPAADANGLTKANEQKEQQTNVGMEGKPGKGLTSGPQSGSVVVGNATPATGTGFHYSNSTLTASDDRAPAATWSAPAAGSGGGNMNAQNKVAESGNGDFLARQKSTTAPASGKKDKEKTKTAITSENYTIKNQIEDNTSTGEAVVRGAIIEKEESDKKRVVTMDGATTKFNTGNYKDAADDFNEILKQQPDNADALYFGGISEYINGNVKKSEKNFDKLLKQGTKFTEGSKWYKANILLKKGKRDEAQKLLDELANSNGSYRERAIKKKAEIEF